MNYLYRADGVKVKKISMNNKIVDYLDGFQYVSEGASLNEFGDVINPIAPNPILQFVPTSEGYYDFTKNSYIYNYVDHLGNVRLSYADSNKNGVIDPSTEIIEENNYYPFGLKHIGYNNLAGNQKYQYKYNGKELQETGMYDYGTRMYMPDIGRWGVIDPLAEIYRRFSPYTYTVNNPIRFTDPDGRTINDPQSKKEAEHTQIGLNMRKSQLELQRNMIYSSATDKNGKVSLSKDQKKEIGNINLMVNEVNKSMNDITDMINDKNNDYVFADAVSNGGAPETKRTGTGQITIYFDDFSKKVHEGRHRGQIARGEYDMNTSGNLTKGTFGVSKEIDAYRAQFGSAGSIEYRSNIPVSSSDALNAIKAGKDPTVTTINQYNQITPAAINSMTDPGYKTIYPPTGIPLIDWNKN